MSDWLLSVCALCACILKVTLMKRVGLILKLFCCCLSFDLFDEMKARFRNRSVGSDRTLHGSLE